jgi:hypothetical protein
MSSSRQLEVRSIDWFLLYVMQRHRLSAVELFKNFCSRAVSVPFVEKPVFRKKKTVRKTFPLCKQYFGLNITLPAILSSS